MVDAARPQGVPPMRRGWEPASGGTEAGLSQRNATSSGPLEPADTMARVSACVNTVRPCRHAAAIPPCRTCGLRAPGSCAHALRAARFAGGGAGLPGPHLPHRTYTWHRPNAQCHIRAAAHGSSVQPYVSSVRFSPPRLLRARGPKSPLRRSRTTRCLRNLRGGGSWSIEASHLSSPHRPLGLPEGLPCAQPRRERSLREPY